ncbi:MAG: hypothetical protein BGO49_10350 [Planctomycetales bacterium 71-10]|nr:MAG: hypothetical protein BGO49_10350 [Planctomycetales bacterium 71-10]
MFGDNWTPEEQDAWLAKQDLTGYEMPASLKTAYPKDFTNMAEFFGKSIEATYPSQYETWADFDRMVKSGTNYDFNDYDIDLMTNLFMIYIDVATPDAVEAYRNSLRSHDASWLAETKKILEMFPTLPGREEVITWLDKVDLWDHVLFAFDGAESLIEFFNR